MFKSFFSGGKQSKEVHRQAETLEMLLSNEDPRDLLRWFKKNAKKLDPSFVDTLADTLDRLLSESSIASTQQLFRLNLLVNELFHHELQTIARNLNQSSQFQLVLIQKKLEEDGVGPRPANARDANDVYKRVYNYRGCSLAEHGHYAASIEHFNATLAIDPHFAPAYCNRARAYVELGRLEDAWADCETLRSFDPGYPEGRATYQLVETLRQLKSSRGGSLTKIAEEHGLLELLGHYDRPLKPGEYAVSLGRQVNPLEMPELSESEATPEELNHLGVVRGRSGDYNGSIEAFNRALQLNPEFDKAYYNRGKAYLLAGAYEKAISDFSFILDRNPQDIEAYELRKQAYEKRERELGTADISIDTPSQGSEGLEFGELDDLSYAGPSAPPRPKVIEEARNLLYPNGLITPDSACTNADALYRQATDLRKNNRYHEAVPLYLSALACYAKLDQLENMSACLNGLGISYKELTREALKRELTPLTEAPPSDWSLATYISQMYRLVYRPVCELVEKGRACHRWGLELHKQLGNLAEQANQISNLGMIEKLMGNLDTARCYQLWALQTHRETGKLADVAIDLICLAEVDRSLGDEESAAIWERQAQEARLAAEP